MRTFLDGVSSLLRAAVTILIGIWILSVLWQLKLYIFVILIVIVGGFAAHLMAVGAKVSRDEKRQEEEGSN